MGKIGGTVIMSNCNFINKNGGQEAPYCLKHQIALSDNFMARRECFKRTCCHLLIGDLVSRNMEYVFPIKHGNISPKIKMRCWRDLINSHKEIKLDYWNEILI